jgi:hypothetical protein
VLPSTGNYKVSFVDLDERIGYLTTGFEYPLFPVGSDLRYVDEVRAYFSGGASAGQCSTAGTAAAIALGVILVLMLAALAAGVYYFKFRGAKGDNKYENVTDGSLIAGGGYL